LTGLVSSATARLTPFLPAERVRRADAAGALAVWLGLVGGVVMLAYSYSYASTHSDADKTHFHLFWLAELLFFVPALIRLLLGATSRGARLAIVVATAVFDYVPKYLRDPTFPLFHDELIHSREVAQIVATGSPFRPSPLIRVIQFFPGMHTTAAALVKLTGAPQFVVQSALLVTLHVLALIGVFVLAEAITRSVRAAGLAAFTYSLNPSFLFFDSQFAYESLAIVFLIWALVALVKAEIAPNARARAGWLVLGAVSGCACVVTHHLTTYALAVTLLMMAVIAVHRALRSRDGWTPAFGATALAVTVTGAAVAWFLFVATGVVGYLGPHVSAGAQQLASLLARGQQARTLFTRSTTPTYERDAAFLAPLIAFAGAAGATLFLRKRWTSSSAVGAMHALAFTYFASLPFIYTQGGNEGARRSWGYTYVGVSLLLAFATEHVLARARSTRCGAVLAGAVVLGVILFVGNTAASIDQYNRFPGPPSARSEARSVTPEIRAAGAWLVRTQGPNRRIVTDQYSGSPLAFFGQAAPGSPSAGFPTWDLYLSPELPSERLAYELRVSKYYYLFANGKIPLTLAYYRTNAVRVPTRRTTTAVISRYDRLPWALKLYGSDHAAIYRLDFAALAAERQLAQKQPQSTGRR
jgi:hypothetical protein